MTVCSERHREFWMRAGADGDRVEVTGQPRFDVYATPSPRATRGVPRVLLLTYLLDAYVPGVGRGSGQRTWEPMLDETEHALVESVRSGDCELVVKFHPQQPRTSEVARVSRIAKDLLGSSVRIADPEADTRGLILDADIVVGFQTTALYESVAAS